MYILAPLLVILLIDLGPFPLYNDDDIVQSLCRLPNINRGILVAGTMWYVSVRAFENCIGFVPQKVDQRFGERHQNPCL